MTEETKRIKINWDSLKKKCPSCKSTSVEKSGVFRRKWVYKTVHKENGVWELKEQQKNTCKACGNEWWD